MTPWQTAINTLRSPGWLDNPLVKNLPTEACQQRALAWMEARAMTDPIRWPTKVGLLANDGIAIEFREGRQLRLQVHFENDGSAQWYEWRENKIIATGQIALPEGEAGETPPLNPIARTSGGF